MKLKKISIVLLILMFITLFTNFIYAKTITETAKDWINEGEKGKDMTFDTEKGTEGFEELAGLLQGIGIFVAIGTGIILGIKFMFSTAEGRAEVSKLLVPYLIGVVVVVAALTIWKICIGILDV